MDNVQAALDAPTTLNVTVQATRRREVRRSSRSREYLTEREIEKLMHAASGVAYRHGLRASELVALRWDDLRKTHQRMRTACLCRQRTLSWKAREVWAMAPRNT